MPHKPRTFMVIRPSGDIVYGFRCCTVSKWARNRKDRKTLIKSHTEEKAA